MDEEHWLRELLNAVCCTNVILERIADSLEWIAPQESERERIALKVYSVNTIGADTAFEYADEWIAERDRQRVRQAE